MVMIKTFRARSLPLALAKVREELGPDAAVLATRDVRGGFLGFGGRGVEVTASSSIQVPSRLPEIDRSLTSISASASLPVSTPNEANIPSDNVPPKDAKSGPSKNLPERSARRQTDQLESMTKKLVAAPNDHRFTKPQGQVTPDPRHVEIMNELLHSGMDPTWARHLLQVVEQSLTPAQWDDPLLVRGKLAHWVHSQLSISPPIEIPDRTQPYVVALVGPTGVGKTTTIAKLAARFTLEDKLKVGLITIDTFRIGAVDQLRRYAEIMSLPMSVVETEQEMQSAIQQLRDCRIIFIDTAGRTPRDTTQIDWLKKMLQAANVDETHLVLSATTSPGNFQDALHRHAHIQPNRLVLSKIDEVRGLGELFPVLRQTKLPMSYVTTGQNVPKDIEPAATTRIAAFMIGQCELDSCRS